MQLVQLYIQIEAAHDTVDELGQLGLVQFRDLNPHINAFQRNFVNEVKRADEMERKLRFFETQINQANDEAHAEGLREIKIDERRDDDITGQRTHMDELESKFEDLEKQIQQMNTNQEALNRNYNQLDELKHVLQKDDDFFKEAQKDMDGPAPISIVDESTLEEGKLGGSGRLGFISGVIDRPSFNTFERILYRATRGNLYMKYSEIKEDIKDPHTGNMTQKNVFCIFFPGQQLQLKIKKICESFSANLYPCPETPAERRNLLAQVNTRLEDLKILLDRGWDQRVQVLGHIALQLRFWQAKIRKEKAIYHTMNLFNYDHGRKCLIAEGWCPVNAIERVQLALRAAKEKSGALVPSILNTIASNEEPPTYFKTNKFTSAFQAIVDSYGIARYGEVNPAVFTIITFPFEFACMFGDVGHGFLLLLFSFFLIRKEKDWEGKKINEMFEICFGGRYVLLLMSIFSIFQGALYNEMFALPVDFGSNWKIVIGEHESNASFWPRNEVRPYAFGVDPVWKGATNELIFYNSLKMKMSIIIGVFQMSVGLVLHLLNGIHFRKWLDVFFEFIPRFIFLQCIFGYLCALIILKWNINWMQRDRDNFLMNRTNPNDTLGEHAGTQQAPVILNELIYMFLPGGPTNNPMYHGQYTFQMALVFMAFISVPIMMLPKPLIMRYQHNQAKAHAVVHHHVEDVEEVDAIRPPDDKKAAGGGHGHGEEFEFGEIMVHQILETIEFVLGSVSHTASYLRLWALSLAHSELATVFWDKIFDQLLAMAATYENVFVTALGAFVAYSAWFGATLMVIMFMESLSAFLHSLRLHWVEFQSKFYKGDGHAFAPFSYQRILSGEEEVM